MNAKFKGLLLAAIAAMGFGVYAADLPDGCRRVWYLQGDGQAYIELDFPLTHEQTVMCEFSCLNLNEAQGIFGARESPSANNCGVFVNDQMIQMQYGDYNQNFDYGKFQSRTRYRLTVGANLREALNLETGVALFSKSTHSDLTFTTPTNCAIYRYYGSSFEDKPMFTGRIFSFTVTKTATGEVEHDLVPVDREGIGYLYDLVTGKLHGNVSQTGQFFVSTRQILDIPEGDFDETNTTSDTVGSPRFRSVVTVHYSGTETLDGFPVLVRLSPDRIPGFAYSQMRSAADLSFCHSDGTLYPFDVDTWNPNGESLIWVRVPKLEPETKFFMRWGHESLPVNVPASTWNANYVAVFHFNGATEDATGHGLTLTTDKVKISTDPSLGGCYEIVGGGVYVDTPLKLLSMPSCVTVSGWYKNSSDPAETAARLLSAKTAPENNGLELLLNNGNVWMRGSGRAKTVMTDGCERTWLQQFTWSHLAGRYAITQGTFFADGKSVVSGEIDRVSTSDIQIGVGNFGGKVGSASTAFSGFIDEVRFYDGAASDDWIAAERATVEDGEFVSVSSPVSTLDTVFARAAISRVTKAGFSVEVELNQVEEGKSVVVRWGASPDELSESRTIGAAKSGAVVSANIRATLVPEQIYYFLLSVDGNGESTQDPFGVRAVYLPLRDDGSALPSDQYGRPAFRAIVSVARASVDAELEGFPLLVRISEERIPGFRYADVASPSDISFAGHDDALYPYEVDTWNPNGESLVWVRVPKLGPQGAQFYLRWGHRKSFTNDPTAVWTKYAAVFHFNGSTASATGNGLACTTNRADVASDEQLGGCYSLGDGTKVKRVSIDAPYAKLSAPDTFTVSAWYKPSQNVFCWRMMSNKAAPSDSSGFEIIGYSDRNIWVRGSDSSGTVIPELIGSLWLVPGCWTFAAGSYSGTDAACFVNGEKVGTGKVAAVKASQTPISVGNFTSITSGGNQFPGLVDEVRFYNGVAPDAWIKAEYMTVNDVNFAVIDKGVPVKSAGLVILVR